MTIKAASVLRLLAVAAALFPAVLGCSSVPGGADAEDQKSYGAQMAKKGHWREALFRFEKAAAMKPEDAEIQNNLAVAYEAVGESARALAVYRRALELAPDDVKIKRNYARFAEYYTGAQRGVATPEPAVK